MLPAHEMVRTILAAMFAFAPDDVDPWWDAPADCPDAAAMTERIDALVPEGKIAPQRRVRIAERGGGLVATMTAKGTDYLVTVIFAQGVEEVAPESSWCDIPAYANYGFRIADVSP